MLQVDAVNRIVDFLVKFDANRKSLLHRHLAQTRRSTASTNRTEVARGPARPAAAPHGVHFENGGDQDCIVLYDIRGHGKDEMSAVTADDGMVVGHIGVADFAALCLGGEGAGRSREEWLRR